MFKNYIQANKIFGFKLTDVLRILKIKVDGADLAQVAGSLFDQFLQGKDINFVGDKTKKSLTAPL